MKNFWLLNLSFPSYNNAKANNDEAIIINSVQYELRSYLCNPGHNNKPEDIRIIADNLASY